MSEEALGFKWKVGDVVMPKFAIVQEDTNDDWRSLYKNEDMRLHIVERLYQECPGGVQRHYDCRPMSSKGIPHMKYIRFNEIELKSYEEPAKK